MPLRTAFKATVDGTRGDVLLDDVDATLGESRIRAHGSVTSTPGAKGRTVTADGDDEGRALRGSAAARRSRPTSRRCAGGSTSTPASSCRPGDEDVPQRLRLRGRFAIRGGRFASDTAQNKIDELSRRGRGEPGNERGVERDLRLRRRVHPAGRRPAAAGAALQRAGGARRSRRPLHAARSGARLHRRAAARRAGLAAPSPGSSRSC